MVNLAWDHTAAIGSRYGERTCPSGRAQTLRAAHRYYGPERPNPRVQVQAQSLIRWPLQIGFFVLALIGFALAMRGNRTGWLLAAIGFVAGLLRNALLAQWGELSNPLHVLAGGLWIGTLFVMLVAGISMVLRGDLAREYRGAMVSDMVYS